jgi:hypothetical protein
MDHAQRSMLGFGTYLNLTAIALLLAPDLLLGTLGFAPTSDFWVRVIGAPVLVLGTYYVRAAREDNRAFMRWSVTGRLLPLLALGGLVAAGLAPPMLILFAFIDAAGAAWTAWALRKTATGAA